MSTEFEIRPKECRQEVARLEEMADAIDKIASDKTKMNENKVDKKKRMIYSAINGFLTSGMLSSGFCVYTALVFDEGYRPEFEWIFLGTGILLLAFLVYMLVQAMIKLRKGQFAFREILKEGAIIFLLSILWFALFWCFWCCVILVPLHEKSITYELLYMGFMR